MIIVASVCCQLGIGSHLFGMRPMRWYASNGAPCCMAVVEARLLSVQAVYKGFIIVVVDVIVVPAKLRVMAEPAEVTYPQTAVISFMTLYLFVKPVMQQHQLCSSSQLMVCLACLLFRLPRIFNSAVSCQYIAF
eukprot:2073122-Amphidinium_carterae.1